VTIIGTTGRGKGTATAERTTGPGEGEEALAPGAVVRRDENPGVAAAVEGAEMTADGTTLAQGAVAALLLEGVAEVEETKEKDLVPMMITQHAQSRRKPINR